MSDLPKPGSHKCWQTIGVNGLGTCPLLDQYDHCKFCVHFIAAGRELLNRSVTSELLQEYSEIYSHEKKESYAKHISVMIFRIGEEWLALETKFFSRAAEYKEPLRVPYRTNSTFSGIAAVSGELLLAMNLSTFFGDEVNEDTSTNAGKKHYAVINRDTERFAIASDEILGVSSVEESSLLPPPSTVANTEGRLIDKIFDYEGKKVSLLDAERLFDKLGAALIR